MNKINHFLISFSIVSYILATSLAFADHSPKKMMRDMKAYRKLPVTKKLVPYDVNLNNMGPCQRAWGQL
jgi:hypothetical protein